MKSLGATPRQICALFLIEAISFSLLGAAFGVVIGALINAVAGEILLLSPVLQPWDVATVVLSAFAVGLGFGVLPALRAAGLPPVEALRE